MQSGHSDGCAPTPDVVAQQIRRAILDETTFLRATFSRPFVRATFSGRFVRTAFSDPAQREQRWIRVVIRPVLVRRRRHLQFSYFEADKDITKNYAGPEAAARLDALLALPYRNIDVESTHDHTRVRRKRDGRPVLQVQPRTAPAPLPDLAHDRRKPTLLGERSREFLQRVGIAGPDGRIRPGRSRKFTQVNEFLRLLFETGEVDRIARSPLWIADLGCGSATLTLAAYHYITEILRRPARMVGVDLKQELIARQATLAGALGWDGCSFHAGRIADFTPPSPPDIVLALHACDTATDEALAQAIRWQSRIILSVPCCHHDLQAQLAGRTIPPPFGPVLRHGILRERWADVLTDAFRALVLRIMGYRTEVIEFVSVEHTTRNLMIRAVSGAPREQRWLREYQELKAYWGVAPHLEHLLGAPLVTDG